MILGREVERGKWPNIPIDQCCPSSKENHGTMSGQRIFPSRREYGCSSESRGIPLEEVLVFGAVCRERTHVGCSECNSRPEAKQFKICIRLICFPPSQSNVPPEGQNEQRIQQPKSQHLDGKYSWASLDPSQSQPSSLRHWPRSRLYLLRAYFGPESSRAQDSSRENSDIERNESGILMPGTGVIC